jgi:hypothetical protein
MVTLWYFSYAIYGQLWRIMPQLCLGILDVFGRQDRFFSSSFFLFWLKVVGNGKWQV